MPLSLHATGGLLSARTYGWAKRLVGRAAGRQDTPDVVGAGEAIELAIDALNEYNWESHTVVGSNVAVVAGTATYDLPSPFKAEYSLRLTTNPRPLRYVRKQDYDNQIWSQTAAGIPVAYTMYNAIQSGKLTLIPTPASADTMEFRYYRPIVIPALDIEALDVQPWVVGTLILSAQVLVATWAGVESTKIDRLQARAEAALRGALSADRNPPTEDARFQAGSEWRPGTWPLEHAYHYIDDWGWE